MALLVNNETLRSAIAKRGFPEAEAGKVHLFGLRLATPWSDHPNEYVQVVPKKFNYYTSTIGCFGLAFSMFLGSVDPGDDYTYNPTNSEGCAHLTDGCWKYQKGSHKGHPAFVQAGEVTVWRDKDEDFTKDSSEIYDTGWFGINIHSGGTSDTIDSWSAGCQIVKGGWEGNPWNTFYRTVTQSGQTNFKYYLLNGIDLEV